jgi:hypothetical protein
MKKISEEEIKRRFEAIEARMLNDLAYRNLILETLKGMKDWKSIIFKLGGTEDVLNYLERLGYKEKRVLL